VLTVDFDLLGVRVGDIMLDAGCGEGRHSFECIARGARVFSMDMDMESVRKARYTLAYMKRSHQAHHEGRYLVQIGDTRKLPFRDETFDRIICAEVMEHVENDDLACRELHRVLKRKGRIAVTVPTFISEMLYDILTYEYFSTPGGHIRKYVPRRLADMMRRNGLEIYGVSFKHALHTIYWLIRCVVGLHLNDHPFTRGYRRFLTLGMNSPFMQAVEGLLDNFFPKSIVLYAEKK
jgi:SAM-dependent methyltransferase